MSVAVAIAVAIAVAASVVAAIAVVVAIAAVVAVVGAVAALLAGLGRTHVGSAVSDHTLLLAVAEPEAGLAYLLRRG